MLRRILLVLWALEIVTWAVYLLNTSDMCPLHLGIVDYSIIPKGYGFWCLGLVPISLFASFALLSLVTVVAFVQRLNRK